MISGAEMALIITSLGTLVTSLGSVVVSLRNSRKIEEVHKSTNGKMEELLAITAKAARAEGIEEQRTRHP